MKRSQVVHLVDDVVQVVSKKYKGNGTPRSSILVDDEVEVVSKKRIGNGKPKSSVLVDDEVELVLEKHKGNGKPPKSSIVVDVEDSSPRRELSRRGKTPKGSQNLKHSSSKQRRNGRIHSSSSTISNQHPESDRRKRRTPNHRVMLEAGADSISSSSSSSYKDRDSSRKLSLTPQQIMHPLLADEDQALQRAMAASKAEHDSNLRKVQDMEYQMALAQDRSKQEQAEKEKLEKERQEKARLDALEEKRQSEAKREEMYKRKHENIAKRLRTEYSNEKGDSIHLRLDLPSVRQNRFFSPNDTVETLMEWVQLESAECLRAIVFEIVFPQERIRSDASTHVLKQKLGSLNIHKTCIRAHVISSPDDDSDSNIDKIAS